MMDSMLEHSESVVFVTEELASDDEDDIDAILDMLAGLSYPRHMILAMKNSTISKFFHQVCLIINHIHLYTINLYLSNTLLDETLPV